MRMVVLCAVAAALLIQDPAAADTVVILERTVEDNTYTPGAPLDITISVNLSTDGSLNALGVEDTVPEGWGYNGLVEGDVIEPFLGKDGLLEFAWFPPPQTFPVRFTYQVRVPPGQTGQAAISGVAIARVSEVEESSNEPVTALTPDPLGRAHSADIDFDRTISLSEMLRVVQHYSLGGLHCAASFSETEDGYIPGATGPQDCPNHTADFQAPDWQITLSELLRVIQLFNGGYHRCPDAGTPDGFCVAVP